MNRREFTGLVAAGALFSAELAKGVASLVFPAEVKPLTEAWAKLKVA